MSKKILVITADKVPFDSKMQVSGVGPRSFSIASSIRKSHPETHLAIPKKFIEGAPDWFLAYENLDDLYSLAIEFDVVIAPYTQHYIPDLFPLLPKNVLRIADGYTPGHIEFFARDDVVTDSVLRGFQEASKAWNVSLTNCDALLVTSNQQKLYYLGMLLALGKINPKNYRETPIMVAPFGIDPSQVIAEPRSNMGPSRTLLWYGGFYPWLDYQLFTEICKELERTASELQILVAGARNPQISEKSFVNPASKAISELELLSNVEFLPWADYGERLNAFENVDAVISLNKMGPETSLSWRLRYTDIVAMAKPLITNGGDPFGEAILSHGAGLKLNGEPDSYVKQILSTFQSSDLPYMAASMQSFAKMISWDSYYEELVSYLGKTNPETFERIPPSSGPKNPKPSISGPINQAGALLQAFRAHSKERGLPQTLSKTLSFLAQKIHQKTASLYPPKKLKGNLVFFHQLEFSGAPRVGLEIVQAIKAINPDSEVTVIVPRVDDQELIQKLNTMKVSVLILSPSQKLSLGDVQSVFVNSSATPWGWIRDASLHWKEAETKYPFVFFNHEQDPETYLDKRKTLHLKGLAEQGLEILVPSRKTQEHLRQLHEVGLDSKIVKLKITGVPSKPINTKTDTIDIILVGQTLDGRKKHGEILAAVLLAQKKAERLENARPINLSFVGVGEDPIGIEVLRMGNLLMKPNTFKSIGRVSFSDCSKLMGEANVVVSMNARESFALYVGETMTGGAVVLRNEAGGTAETLQNGKNGFKIHDSIEDLAEKILFLADKDKCPNQMLESMMLESKNQVKPYVDTNYEEVISLLSQNGH